ncbi:hypothetical protein [Ahniella affigens]|nr:hypothetical protein [Ahniella affigens]
MIQISAPTHALQPGQDPFRVQLGMAHRGQGEPMAYRTWPDGAETPPAEWNALPTREFAGLSSGIHLLHAGARDGLGRIVALLLIAVIARAGGAWRQRPRQQRQTELERDVAERADTLGK